MPGPVYRELTWIRKGNNGWVLRYEQDHFWGMDLAMVMTEVGTGVVVAKVLTRGLPGHWDNEEGAKARCEMVLSGLMNELACDLRNSEVVSAR